MSEMSRVRMAPVFRKFQVVRVFGRCGRMWSTRWVPYLALCALLMVCFWLVGGVTLVGCTPQALVDDASPRLVEGNITAGSKLTENSQYVEVRLTFDHELEAAGSVVDDVDVRVNGEAFDTRTMKIDVYVQGSSVVVRLVPSSAADGTQTSLYYALYDGLVSVAAQDESGGLPHVRVAGGQSNAVLDAAQSFTVPSGVEVTSVTAVPGDAVTGTPASVTFDVERFAQLRCCTWFSFFDGAPLVMMHNHEFLRDTNQSCAARLVDTVNASYAESFEAEAQGARVTVWAKDVVDGQEPVLRIVEGAGVDPRAGVLEYAGAAVDPGDGTGADSAQENQADQVRGGAAS